MIVVVPAVAAVHCCHVRGCHGHFVVVIVAALVIAVVECALLTTRLHNARYRRIGHCIVLHSCYWHAHVVRKYTWVKLLCSPAHCTAHYCCDARAHTRLPMRPTVLAYASRGSSRMCYTKQSRSHAELLGWSANGCRRKKRLRRCVCNCHSSNASRKQCCQQLLHSQSAVVRVVSLQLLSL
jgi:hypothetical protein